MISYENPEFEQNISLTFFRYGCLNSDIFKYVLSKMKCLYFHKLMQSSKCDNYAIIDKQFRHTFAKSWFGLTMVMQTS